jgi:hypothetical protein
MHCFKTEETLFENVLPFHAKTSPTAQYSLSSTSVLPWEYSSTAKEVLANDKILI